ncbi:MAG: hypothetical protein JXQ99_26490 [Hyphomicrobiaceae bacterium]
MQYVCDAQDLTWFRLETEAEAAAESQLMDHAVEKYFQKAYDDAVRAWAPPASVPAMEQNIGLKAHIERTMPRFLTLRNNEGTALVTAMLPPDDRDLRALRPVIVGHGNSDPYREYAEAIEALGRHVNLDLDPDVCFPYRR